MATPRTISLDAMGGDRGPAVVVPGAALALERHPDVSFLLYGNKERVEPFLLAYPELAERSKIIHTETVVEMQDKPSQAVRRGRASSMWLSIEAVQKGEADFVVSAGNTGALMAMSKLVLKTMPGIERPAIPARPKRTLLDPYFRAVGIDGMTDPFFLETLVVRGLLPFEEPFVIAHEWSHLAGFTDEGEANFVGWLTCLRGSESGKYSGWLFLYSQAVASLPSGERAAVEARLGQGPRRDLQLISERIRRELQPQLSAAGWRVYDSYLKANRVEAGTASYAYVVRLVLGTRSAGLF